MSGWISVSERLPDNNDRSGFYSVSDFVLVSNGAEPDMCRLINGRWHCAYSGEEIEFEPTHWQPLPEPPCT
jgi:hypothetical protein